MAYRGNWQDLIRFIAGCMEASLSLRDLMTGEKVHQVFWNAYLGLSNLYIIYSEKEMNQGFRDLVMVPMLEQNPNIKYSYLIELKYLKLSDAEKQDAPGKYNPRGITHCVCVSCLTPFSPLGPEKVQSGVYRYSPTNETPRKRGCTSKNF